MRPLANDVAGPRQTMRYLVKARVKPGRGKALLRDAKEGKDE